MTTSRSTRSGGSAAISSRASRPEAAPATTWPSGDRTASMSRRFWSVSSTTRILDGRVTLLLVGPPGAVGEHLRGKRQNIDRLGDQPGESRFIKARPIGLQYRRGQGHDRDGCRRGLAFELPRGLDPVDARERDIHEDEVGLVFPGHDHGVLAVHRLHRAEAMELEDIASQLHVLFVVLDDEDQSSRADASHGDTGSPSVMVAISDSTSV